jgi:hypothetical protein
MSRSASLHAAARSAKLVRFMIRTYLMGRYSIDKKALMCRWL